MTDDHTDTARIARLQARIAELERRVQTTEDTEAIKRLTRIYGYYLDKALWSEVLPLFTDDCSIEISMLGVYLGKRQAETLFRDVLGKGPAKSDERGLLWGQLYNHMLLQGVVHVAPDGRHARGRWRCFMQIATFGEKALWGEGPYEIEYRKEEDGLWRIRKLHFYRTFHTPFDEGWKTARSPVGGVRADFPPDLPPTEQYEPYPAAYIPPFHYRNPVTGT
ncbi:nuclear transport factor 2 family protein [Verticiella sediminum]|uniref:Nuclear transport factor 2 family protein n=1 Tax=Verticiella sediminum TaxID=1247510 RepID=A0A556A7K7_9BURK|nr:nuclear transport factor 2 family protein [Verticiella sediminum]TSH88874.1 nuclear transport factor 2 family protein [Verticiella sediminum]